MGPLTLNFQKKKFQINFKLKFSNLILYLKKLLISLFIRRPGAIKGLIRQGRRVCEQIENKVVKIMEINYALILLFRELNIKSVMG
jgi:hypothetical protein